MIKLLFITLCLLLLSASASLSQSAEFKHAQGDSTLKEVVAPRVRAIYELEGQRAFLLTQENLLDLEGVNATELHGTYVDEHFSRIVAITWTEEGKYSVEYYWEGEALIFTYETFEYFEELSPKDSWRNFKGIASWERRSYFDAQAVGYVESVGLSASRNAERLVAAGHRLSAVLSKQIERGR